MFLVLFALLEVVVVIAVVVTVAVVVVRLLMLVLVQVLVVVVVGDPLSFVVLVLEWGMVIVVMDGGRSRLVVVTCSSWCWRWC